MNAVFEDIADRLEKFEETMSEMEDLYEELNEYQKDILQQAFADGEF